MSVGSSWFNLANHIDAPHYEGPRRSQNIQRIGRNVHFIGINLTLVTNSGVIITIVFHYRPIMNCSQDFLVHGMTTGMHSEGTFMDIFYDLICFMSIHAYEQNKVIVSLCCTPIFAPKIPSSYHINSITTRSH